MLCLKMMRLDVFHACLWIHTYISAVGTGCAGGRSENLVVLEVRQGLLMNRFCSYTYMTKSGCVLALHPQFRRPWQLICIHSHFTCMASPGFGRSVNPILTRGTDYAHLITSGTLGFSDLPTTLTCITKSPIIDWIYLRSCLCRNKIFNCDGFKIPFNFTILTYFSFSTEIPVPTLTSWLTPIPRKLFWSIPWLIWQKGMQLFAKTWD